MIHQFRAALAASILLAAAPVPAQEADAWLPSLMTETPQEGFDLAISMARRAVKTTQPKVETLMELRPAYSHDPDSLIEVSGVVASYFSTIAAANEYWRE